MNSLTPHRATPPATGPASAMVLAQVPQDSEGLDFAAVFDAARRRYALFLVVFVAVILVAIALTLAQKPKYTASSAVMMDPRQIQIFQNTQSSPNVSGDLSVSTEAVATQVQVLTSRGMAERVVDALHLDQDPSLANPKPGLRAKAMRFVGGPFGLWQPQALTPQEQRQGIVDLVLGRLDVQRLGLTYVIGIKYTDPTSDRAAEIANGFADSYIQQSIQGEERRDASGGRLSERPPARVGRSSLLGRGCGSAVSRFAQSLGLAGRHPDRTGDRRVERADRHGESRVGSGPGARGHRESSDAQRLAG